MVHWGVDDVTATLEGEYMQWPLFLFTLYRPYRFGEFCQCDGTGRSGVQQMCPYVNFVQI